MKKRKAFFDDKFYFDDKRANLVANKSKKVMKNTF